MISKKWLGLFSLLMVAALLVTVDQPRVVVASEECEDLMGLSLPNTAITLAESVPAGPGLPAYCKVAGTVDTEINFEVWMPVAESWNGKFNGVGNLGLAGFINYGDMSVALARGYATASTDTGHVGDPTQVIPPLPFLDGSWALNADRTLNMERLVNFGHAGTHKMTVAAKAIVAAYYGQAPAYAYFTGCSCGGQQGLAEAQRYPDDYNGIVAAAPANYPMHLWPGQFYPAVLMKDMDVIDLVHKLDLISNGVLAQCDGMDGVVDGLLQDPRCCGFDPATLQCEGGDDPSTCLTPEQVDVVGKIYAGLHDPFTGEQIWPGFEPSSESWYQGDPNSPWDSWWVDLEPFAPLIGYFKYMVYKDPAWDWTTFDFRNDYGYYMGAAVDLGPILDATDPDLTDFKDQGGKMIVWHGWIDQFIAPRNSIHYYESVEAAMAEGDTEIGDFFRLFMVPGVKHCSGGPGPGTFDALAALEQWVEEGVAPDQILATNTSTGMTRPLCPYPSVARWKGQGSTDDAANFLCSVSQMYLPLAFR